MTCWSARPRCAPAVVADRGAAPVHRAVDASISPGFELEVGQARDRAFRLRNALAPLQHAAPEQIDFSYVLVDCPPSLNLLTVNAMAAANAILVPLQCEFFALEGLSQLLKTVEQVARRSIRG